MALRVGLLGSAHVHAGSYVAHLERHPEVEWQGRFEPEGSTPTVTATPLHENLQGFLSAVDAVVIATPTGEHAHWIEIAAGVGKAILCEKPIAVTPDHGMRIRHLVESSGVFFMTAFPCRFAPAFLRAEQRLHSHEIGTLAAVAATNHGRCPGGWFVDPELGGGALLDHVVHVADLLKRLWGEDPVQVTAQTGKMREGLPTEDLGMVTLDYAHGRFATIDSSWSRLDSYRTWGDLTMNLVGTQGVIELDLFAQEMEIYSDSGHRSAGYGSSLDALLVDAFVRDVLQGNDPRITLDDGLSANAVAWAAIRSAQMGGEPVPYSAV